MQFEIFFNKIVLSGLGAEFPGCIGKFEPLLKAEEQNRMIECLCG